VPANRSRTSHWRRCLQQIHERGGALEIAIASHEPDQTSHQHLVWRVRLLGMNDAELLVEQPAALGQVISIDVGIELIVVMAIGQNRWIFTTKNLGPSKINLVDRHAPPPIRLAMPQAVERCQRRQHDRVEPTSLVLPRVEIWPLLDPKSVLVVERAYQVQQESSDQDIAGRIGCDSGAPPFDYEAIMPEVGPKFTGSLLNLGGGGIGLRIGPDDAQAVNRHKLLWLRMALPTALQTPICATGKVVHTHIESNHDLYVGLAFDFTFNAAHQKFVVDQIRRYIAFQQKSQMRKFIVPDQKLRTA
jgi:hypothetical protein